MPAKERPEGTVSHFSAAFCLRRGYPRAYVCVQDREQTRTLGCSEAPMRRREFLHRAAYAAGTVWLHPRSLANRTFPMPALARKFSASETVRLGNTGIQTSRLAMGTGTVGSGHHSHQTALGIQGLCDLLLNGYDHGLRFFDSADSYGSHPHVAEALKYVPREKVTVLTKSWARDEQGMRADIERFRKELRTDYLDVFLMHCLTEPDWTVRFRGAMDAL